MHASLSLALDRLEGIGRRAELISAGAVPSALAPAWREGSVIRIRNGIYARPTVDRHVTRAVRVGGVLSGSSALRRFEFWQPPGSNLDDLTVSVIPNTPRLRDPDDCSRPLDRSRQDVHVLYDGHRLHPYRERLCVGPTTCLVQVIRSTEPRYGLAVLDSALRTANSRIDMAEVSRRLPSRCRHIVAAADNRSESGTESVLRWMLRTAGIPFAIQVKLTSAIRVDFVVAGFLVVECTSFEYHASPQQYQADRERIAALVLLGFTVLEFTYHQVLFDDETVLAAIRAALAAHRSRP